MRFTARLRKGVGDNLIINVPRDLINDGTFEYDDYIEVSLLKKGGKKPINGGLKANQEEE